MVKNLMLEPGLEPTKILNNNLRLKYRYYINVKINQAKSKDLKYKCSQYLDVKP